MQGYNGLESEGFEHETVSFQMFQRCWHSHESIRRTLELYKNEIAPHHLTDKISEMIKYKQHLRHAKQ